MDNFLETYNLPKLNQEEIENMKGKITSNEIESVIKILPTKVEDQMASQVNSTSQDTVNTYPSQTIPKN